MAECLVTAGIAANDCTEKFGVPGIEDKFYIANHSEVTAYSETVPGEIDALSFTSGKGVKEVFYKDATGSYIDSLVSDSPSGFYYNQNLTVRVTNKLTATRNSIEDMVGVNVVLIVEDADGKWKIFGETKGLKLTVNDNNSGTVAGDEAGDLLTFTGINLGKIKEFLATDKATTDALLSGYIV